VTGRRHLQRMATRRQRHAVAPSSSSSSSSSSMRGQLLPARAPPPTSRSSASTRASSASTSASRITSSLPAVNSRKLRPHTAFNPRPRRQYVSRRLRDRDVETEIASLFDQVIIHNFTAATSTQPNSIVIASASQV